MDDTIKAVYEYTYDDGDNLTTKVTPFEDNFNDGNGTGWSTLGTWTFTGYEARSNVDATVEQMHRNLADDDHEIRFDYVLDSASTAAIPRIDIQFRYNTTSGERLMLRLQETQAQLYDYDGSSWTLLDTDTAADSDLDTWYTARIVADGASVKVYQAERGGTETLVIDETSVSEYNGSRVSFVVAAETEAVIDNIRIIADDLETETTYTYASNNELSTMVDYNGTTTFTYDDWGRTISKTRGGKTATYGWGENHKIVSVDSDFPDEGDVDYQYGGDGKRRERDEEDGTDITWYNWNGFSVINEEADGAGLGDGALTRTYVGGLADIAGSNPATGTARYNIHDHLASTRGVFNASKTSLGTFEFTPYGSPYHFNGPADITHLFTGHDLDPRTGNYFAPFRYLNPSAGRWLKQDPLGMINGPNMYGYVGGNPIMYYDPYGLEGFWGTFLGSPFPWIIAGGLLGAVFLSPGLIPGMVAGAALGMGLGYFAHMAWEAYHIPETAHEIADPWAPMFNERLDDIIDLSEPCP